MYKAISSESGFIRRLRIFSALGAGFIFITSILDLVGWQYRTENLKRVLTGFVAMNPLTAVCLMIAAVAIMLLHTDPASTSHRRLARLFGAAIAIVGALVLARYIFNLPLSPDRWLYHARLDAIGDMSNNMAPNTAICMLFGGVALILVDNKNKLRRYYAQILALIVSSMAFLALIGYAYDARSLTAIGGYIPMAINSAFCLLFLGLSILALRSKQGLMFLFGTDLAAGTLVRRLLLAVVTIPPTLGWLSLLTQRHDKIDVDTGTALYVVSSIFAFGILIWISGGALYKKEQEVAEAKDEFLGLATHQLQTPITGVKMNLAMLRDNMAGGKLNTEQKELVRDAYEGNERERRIVNDLLNVARADSGRMVLEKSVVDLGQLVSDVIEEQRPTIDSRKQHLKIIVTPIKALIDSNRLRMAIENLVSNASKYTQDKGKIEIETGETKHEVFIKVSDSGVGVAADDMPKLFTKFGRVDNALSKERDGTGLGLYLVKQIVELHGGEVKVASKPGKGTEFTLLLPKS